MKGWLSVSTTNYAGWDFTQWLESQQHHTVTRDESFPYQLGRVVERPLELNLGGIGLHPADDVHQLTLGDSVDDGVRVSTDRDV